MMLARNVRTHARANTIVLAPLAVRSHQVLHQLRGAFHHVNIDRVGQGFCQEIVFWYWNPIGAGLATIFVDWVGEELALLIVAHGDMNIKLRLQHGKLPLTHSFSHDLSLYLLFGL